MREGRPSLFATEARPPAVIKDHVAQQIFSDDDNPDPNFRGGFRGLFVFVVNFVFSICYNFVSTIPSILFNIFRGDERRSKLSLKPEPFRYLLLDSFLKLLCCFSCDRSSRRCYEFYQCLLGTLQSTSSILSRNLFPSFKRCQTGIEIFTCISSLRWFFRHT